MTRIAIIGLGYWGPNLVRAFDGLPDAEVTMICDRDATRLMQVATRFPHVRATDDAEEVFTSGHADAVVIATPTATHHRLAKRALEAGLHVFVEKPLASTAAQCEELIALSEARGLTLMCGHIFLYTAAVAKLRDYVQTGELGHLCCITAARRNLGPIRSDVNALWDLAPHDISIILHLLGETPLSVNCQGLAHLRPDVHDVCVLTMHFPSGLMAVVHSSWLDPNKERRMTLVGTRKMAVYDDIEPLEKIRVYDKGVDAPPHHVDFGEFPFSYRYGDTCSPYLVEEEPLKAEARHFVECAGRGVRPRSDGQGALDVVRVLEAADRSLAAGGARVSMAPEPVRASVPAARARRRVRVPAPGPSLAVTA
ncbi:MAG TPA: Gfo/Idh/MocA family oxidoreductase [Longimicrobium sp.]|nr:Gfo/Idh/MocA family oxidoreductase [Longimicrobium sp.]